MHADTQASQKIKDGHARRIRKPVRASKGRQRSFYTESPTQESKSRQTDR